MPTWTGRVLFADNKGTSRLDSAFTQELAEVNFAPPAPPMFVGPASDVQAVVIVEMPVGWQGGWDPTPREQWVICLAGELGYEAGDGATFRLRPGECILTTDTHGQGHNSW